MASTKMAKQSKAAANQRRQAAQAYADKIDAMVIEGNAATARADGVALRLALDLASDAEVRQALDVDPANPYANATGLVTTCMLAGRWDLLLG